MSRKERVYYVCDYCNKEIDYMKRNGAYTDNNYFYGTRDMCSKECLKKHLRNVEDFINKGYDDEYKNVGDYEKKNIRSFWV